MRKKRFLAILAAIAISISFVTPLTAFATEVEEETDTIDDELEEGEQTTIAAPGADSDSSSNSNSSSSSNTGSSSSGTSGTTGSTNSGTKSSDSSLAHLGISPGSLSPAFSAGTHEYTASVDAGVTSISVAARPNSSKAVIASVSGAKSLAPGSNTVKVVVEAENGATSTYTITVNCGSASSSAQPNDQSQTDDSAQTGEEQTLEGEISAIEDQTEKQSEVTFDSNGYLIYEGNAYMPSSMMPEGEYVSLDKYNKLYEQSQGQKTRDMRVIIVGIVIIVLLLIVILNLALKLRDVRQDVKLGLDGVDDEDDGSEKKRKQKESMGRKSELKMTDTSMIPDVKLPEQTKTQKTAAAVKTQKPAKPEKPIVQKQEKAVVSKLAKASKSAKKAEDLEILDLNDL